MPAFVDLEKFAGQLAALKDAKFIAVAGEARIVSGTNPLAPEWEYDLVREQFVPIAHSQTPGQRGHLAGLSEQRPVIDASELALPAALSFENSRATGTFDVILREQRYRYHNLKQALGGTVVNLSDDPSFLDRLSTEGSRSRRLIARSPHALFDNAKMSRNAKKYAANLENGWWLNTNNSEAQVKFWFNVIARVANLSWNRDFRIEF